MTDLRKAAAYTKPGTIVPVNNATTQLLVDALRQALEQPKCEWVGLTLEEINEVLGSDIHDEPSGELKFIRAIEAKLKEKNT